MIEKILERLEEKRKNYNSHVTNRDDVCMADGLKIATKIVQEVAKNGGWIPCSERLPEEKGTYLVTVKHFGVTFGRFTGDKDNLHFDSNVIAWQPLPAPYQKGE